MNYYRALEEISKVPGIEWGSLMKTPCLRYGGEFMAMIFEKEEALIIKVSPERVQDIISDGLGSEFNYTKKPFREWVLIPFKLEADYMKFLEEALAYVKKKSHTEEKKKLKQCSISMI